jgi:hypothetical protein
MQQYNPGQARDFPMERIIRELLELLAGYFKAHRTARNIAATISGLFLVGLSFGILYFLLNSRALVALFSRHSDASSDALSDIIYNHQFIFITIVIAGAVSLIFFTAALAAFSKHTSISQRDIDLEPIRKEREEIRDGIKEGNPDIFDTIQLNLSCIVLAFDGAGSV